VSTGTVNVPSKTNVERSGTRDGTAATHDDLASGETVAASDASRVPAGDAPRVVEPNTSPDSDYPELLVVDAAHYTITIAMAG
jgi:hypothetical protein